MKLFIWITPCQDGVILETTELEIDCESLAEVGQILANASVYGQLAGPGSEISIEVQ